MEELIAKLNEAREIMRNLNVINCGVEGGRIQILVNKFADVPTKNGTEYKLRGEGSGCLPYEKRYVEDSVIIHTYGTKADMVEEFAEVEK